MAQLSDDCFAFGGDLLSISAALALLEAQVTRQVETETVPLKEARGRILAAPLVAPRDVPPHDNAAVDGYAVFFDDLAASEPTTLPVGGRAAAGHALARAARRGEAVRLFTGAPMPEGPDTLLMPEDCSEAEGVGRLSPRLNRRPNRRPAREGPQAGP